MEDNSTLQFVNCRILKKGKIYREDLWVRNGVIINPEQVFFDEKTIASEKVDCQGRIIAPGFIELQINGGSGIDFSQNLNDVEGGVAKVSKVLLEHGVTSFCPTIVTSPPEVYHTILPRIKRKQGGEHGATILGLHLEGPFINTQKKGAHPIQCISKFENGVKTLLEIYGDLSQTTLLTLAPELEKAEDVIKYLVSKNITVSLGHSMAGLQTGEEAIDYGATFITHLFNAMLPFHHRDPGLVGLLASEKICEGKSIYFGIISDGIHTHPAALRIAYRTHRDGLVLVTDAISAMGLEEGKHNLGQLTIEIREKKAYIEGTHTLCGSIASMNECVKFFLDATNCSKEYVLEAASLHPAQALGIEAKKGTLNFGADADLIILDEDLTVLSTWIAGKCVFKKL